MDSDEFDFMISSILERITDVLKANGLIDTIDENYIRNRMTSYECWRKLKDKEN